MRTTLNLDDDVAALLESEARRSGRSIRETVNDALRRGLTPTRTPSPRQPFRVQARDLGELRPGLTLDGVADLLERVEDAPLAPSSG